MSPSPAARRPHPFRGCGPAGRPTSPVRRALTAAAVVSALSSATACGPSPVDMVDHPVTTTPSRAAGRDLQRSAEPEKSCAAAPIAPEAGRSGDREVGSLNADGQPGTRRLVPSDPGRILALGAGAADAACLLGLQGAVVATGPLPGASTWLPEPLSTAPRVDTTDPAAIASAVAAHRPDLVLLPLSAGGDGGTADVLEAIGTTVPVVVYPDDPGRWTDAVTALTDALGRPGAGELALLDFIDRVDRTAATTTPRDTEVSVVDLGDDRRPAAVVDPDSLGARILETVGARRPPAQQVGVGAGAPSSPPAVADEFSGDLVLGVLDDCPGCEQHARELLETERWKSLPPLSADRFFVVDASVWLHGDGLVAARAVLQDIEATINATGGAG